MGQGAMQGKPVGIAEAQLARVAADGLAGHSHVAKLRTHAGPQAARDLADAVHLLCQLYGRHPGMLDMALSTTPAGPVRDWMMQAAEAFDRERMYLVQLTSQVGPMPSTPGAAQTESAMIAQRRAIETLACSERDGCSLGAATALVADWPLIRAVLDAAAVRFGHDAPAPTMPGDAESTAAIREGIATVPAERALSFGTDQLLLQHRGLFDLLEARADARDKADGII
ncbi:DUF6975 family protein [Sphingomicrobium clamense]|uniref:Uncharacterized protein n=1 Tax=Sphingomicrobium clamense TaxID=2851013 RepID=A0ABS6V6U7_9SPHN|nr:hypothetical protein [Sphingomicrobium sp. B8]MBW0145085.1 hypothetical protein [Sphingomicrobium sp. B8]